MLLKCRGNPTAFPFIYTSSSILNTTAPKNFKRAKAFFPTILFN